MFLRVALLLSLICVRRANAQDVIVKRNGEELKVKLLMVSPQEIRYKLFDLPDGPQFSTDPGSVLMLRYEDGAVDTITAVQPVSGREQTGLRQVPLEFDEENWYRYDQKLYKGQVRELLKTSDNTYTRHDVASFERKQRGGFALLSIAAPMVTFGVGLAVLGRYGSNYYREHSVFLFGAGLALVGVLPLTLGINTMATANDRLWRAAEAYNSAIKSKPGWSSDTFRFAPAQGSQHEHDIRLRTIQSDGERYRVAGKPVNRHEVIFYIQDGGDAKAIALTAKSARSRHLANMLRVVGTPLFFVSGMLAMQASGYSSRYPFLVGGGIGVLAGATMVTAGFFAHYQGKARLYKAVAVHNDKVFHELEKK